MFSRSLTVRIEAQDRLEERLDALRRIEALETEKH